MRLKVPGILATLISSVLTVALRSSVYQHQQERYQDAEPEPAIHPPRPDCFVHWTSEHRILQRWIEDRWNCSSGGASRLWRRRPRNHRPSRRYFTP